MSGERPLIDRLGVLPGMRVSVIGLKDPVLIDGIRARAKEVITEVAAPGSDIVIFQIEHVADLAGVICLRNVMHAQTAVWVMWPKGRQDIKQSHVMAAGLACGLVDVKIVSVSDELSALKFVIPVSDRHLAPEPPERTPARF